MTSIESINQELLFALKNLLAVKNGEDGTKYHSDDIARAAIAKAEEALREQYEREQIETAKSEAFNGDSR